jgi:hypothetical protein
MSAETFAKQIALYLDVTAVGDNPLATVTSTSASAASAKSFVQGSYPVLRLNFGYGGEETPWVPLALDTGDVISVTGKATNDLDTILFFADTFTAAGTAEAPYYEGAISLNGSSLDTALGSALALACLVDIKITGTTGLKYVFHYELTVRRRVHEDTPADPDLLPSYLT